MDPFTAAIGVGLATGSLAVGVASYHEARKARQSREGSPAGHQPTTRLWQKGGNEQLFFGSDGSVAAIGYGPGDFSMGFVQTGKHSKQSKKAVAQTAMLVQSAAMMMAEQRQYEMQQQQQRIHAGYRPHGYLEHSPSSYSSQRPQAGLEYTPSPHSHSYSHPSQSPYSYTEADRYPPRRPQPRPQQQGYIIGEEQEPPEYSFKDHKRQSSNSSSSSTPSFGSKASSWPPSYKW